MNGFVSKKTVLTQLYLLRQSFENVPRNSRVNVEVVKAKIDNCMEAIWG